MITVPEVSSVRDADRIMGLLSAAEIDDCHLLVNRMRADMVRKGDMLALDDTLDILGIELIGVVPEDESIIRSSNMGEPIVSNNKAHAGRAYQNIARRIMGENVPLLKLKKTVVWHLYLKSFLA